MSSRGMSRPFAIGAVAAQGIMPVVAILGHVLIFAVTPDVSMVALRPDWVLTAIVAVNATVHLLAATGAIGMYWVPRLLVLRRLDGYRVRPAGHGMLTYLAIFPLAVAAIGVAWQQGNIPWWYFLLTMISLVLVVPALADVLVRGWFDKDSTAAPGSQQLGSGPAGDLLPVGNFDLTLPGRWLRLPQEAAPGWAQEGAARLSDGPEWRDTVARELERTARELTTEPHLMIGVWVPVQTSPRVVGMLTVDRITPPAGQRVDREHYRALIEPDHRQKVTVFGRYIDDIEVPAGPALVVTEVVGQSRSRWTPWNKMIGQSFIFTVFPRGCSEALQLAFSTSVVELEEVLQTDAVAMMDSLSVSLREVQSS